MAISILGKRVRESIHEYHVKADNDQRIVVSSVTQLSEREILEAAQAQLNAMAAPPDPGDGPETTLGLDRHETLDQLRALRDRAMDPSLNHRLDRLITSFEREPDS